MNCGMKLVGHQAPPTALMVRMSNVPMPFAAAAVGASAASNMPKAMQALAAARQMRSRLKTLLVISTPKKDTARDEKREQLHHTEQDAEDVFAPKNVRPSHGRGEQSLIQTGFLFIEERSGRAGERKEQEHHGIAADAASRHRVLHVFTADFFALDFDQAIKE